ncbi:uncharacterized protein LOC110682829 [Chenopodium quinoa]|uniref:uncharacterized protein LOC110682829 n=1 Tax=Chenopodium quinoa TaxID=63459 RepID=UPI000B790A6D|nr:uncharacterized protein LOC110682829 [Chenopodium quinoa]
MENTVQVKEITEEERGEHQQEFNNWLQVIHSSASAINDELRTDEYCDSVLNKDNPTPILMLKNSYCTMNAFSLISENPELCSPVFRSPNSVDFARLNWRESLFGGTRDEEVDLSGGVIVCHIIGTKLPLSVVSGFARRMWGRYGIDKVSLMTNGVFLVRFRTIEARDRVLGAGPVWFDNKPVIVKQWVAGMDLDAEPVDLVPIWVRLPGLKLKYWGQKTLTKLASMIGNPIKTDKATTTKERLEYARIMIEVKFNVDLPDCIEFLDESGNTIKQALKYEWRPVICKVCGGIGHADAQCPNHKVQVRNKVRTQPEKA